MKTKIETGDWVRFYSDGELVIGQVEYLSKSTIGTRYLQTDKGAVDEAGVLETRKPDESQTNC